MSASPFIKFFTADWRSDPALRSCSLEARGLWMELLCLMHEADPRGSLLVNGQPPTEKQLAMLVGIEKKTIAKCMVELEISGVFSRDPNGTIYSRKMRRQEARSRINKENGSQGGNPKLLDSDKPSDNQNCSNLEARSYIPEKNAAAGGARDSVDLVFETIGVQDDPHWYGYKPEVARWFSKWDLDLDVLPSIRRMMAGRTGPPKSPRYFEPGIAEAHARRLTPLPEVQIEPAKVVRVRAVPQTDKDRRKQEWRNGIQQVEDFGRSGGADRGATGHILADPGRIGPAGVSGGGDRTPDKLSAGCDGAGIERAQGASCEIHVLAAHR